MFKLFKLKFTRRTLNETKLSVTELVCRINGKSLFSGRFENVTVTIATSHSIIKEFRVATATTHSASG